MINNVHRGMPRQARGAARSPAKRSQAPWVNLYPTPLTEELDCGCEDALSLFRAAVRTRPDGPALIYFDEIISYSTLDADSDALALWLQDKGVGAGDRVCVVTQNIPAFPLLCIAAWKVGAIPVPGNPMYKPAELSRLIADAEPNAILCQEGESESTLVALADAGLNHIPFVIASPHDMQSRNDSRILPSKVASPQGTTLASILEEYRGRTPQQIDLDPDDLGLILYTSGTTGAPKGAMIRHSSLAFNGQIMRDWCGLTDRDTILAIAPLFHITGFACHMCTAFSARCGMLINYRFNPQVVVELVKEHRPTFTIGAITAFNAIAGIPDVTAADLSSLTKVWSGGAPIPPTLRDNIQNRLGISILTSYGMTELTSAAVLAPPSYSVPQRDDVLSIGIPIPSTDIRIADEQGHEVGVGESGELLVRGPQVMAGYWRKPEESDDALNDGWMHSGDIGFMDAGGWVYLVDRKKDVIIASGFKIWPREVEDVLYSHPHIREAAVIGVADPYRGETVKACVSLAPSGSTTEEELIAFCRERLTGYKVPRIVVIMDDLPKTISGKIQRAELRKSPEPS